MNVALEHSNHIVKLQALTYIERHGRTGRTIWNYAKCTLTHSKGPDSMLNRIALSISTAEKCARMQVVKQPETGKLQPLRNKNVPPFRRTMINN